MHKNLMMKELPESERPYERCEKYGAEILTDAELLAVIIRSGSKNQRCTDLAAQVLQRNDQGLLNLIYLSLEDLRKIPGIGPKKAIQLKCIAELSKRITNLSRKDGVRLLNPESIASYFMEDMRHLKTEHVIIAFFDIKGKLLGKACLSMGSATKALASPAEIFHAAIQNRADYIVLLHNHPSGDPSPSEEDDLITARMESCGELMDIPLVDHIIIGDNSFYSYAAHRKE